MNTVKIISAGKEGDALKDQDRADVFYAEEGEKYTAIVCDGITTSPNAEQAAEYVVSNVSKIFDQPEDGLHEIVRGLLEKRKELLAKGVKLSPEQESSRKLFEDIVKEKLEISYQTTLVAVQWTRDEVNLRAKWVYCGDSAIFVFNADGEVLSSNRVDQNTDSFRHTSPITQVIPDSYNKKKHLVSEEKLFPRKGHTGGILLCSDGFYDGFETFKEIYDWIQTNKQSLVDETKRDALMQSLHDGLRHKKGDDDISIVLDWPALRSE